MIIQRVMEYCGYGTISFLGLVFVSAAALAVKTSTRRERYVHIPRHAR